ncbi:MAG: glycosyltransferase, partial [Pseudomonadota bacterium]|nr:glycosyltransferase [Pseudomonadota bacterium]
MTDRMDGVRVLIYSHDTFGLGHLRRCRTIAHALVEKYKGLSVLILSGSPIIGSFDFRARVDFVRIPGVIKLYNGEYTSLGLHLDLSQTMAIRASIIRHTAEMFAPDLFIVDKEPLGLRGELQETLSIMKSRRTTLVLGLRDVMDEPTLLRREWKSGNLLPVLEDLYDEIWVYGHDGFWDPLAEMNVPASVREKMIYTGYLRRTVPKVTKLPPAVNLESPYLLITAGGGGDGDQMMDWVLRAYETRADLMRAVLVLGPFMRPEMQTELRERASKLDSVEVLTFESHLELMMEKAAGIVAMGGYNTFCEILSLDKPALIMPRVAPRKEQLVRAERAAALGVARMFDPSLPDSTLEAFVAALRDLPRQAKPSSAMPPGFLDGV